MADTLITWADLAGQSRVIFWITSLLVFWPLSEGEDDLGCDRVMTSEHGVLLSGEAQ